MDLRPSCSRRRPRQRMRRRTTRAARDGIVAAALLLPAPAKAAEEEDDGDDESGGGGGRRERRDGCIKALSLLKKKKRKREEEKSSLSLSTFLYKPGIRVVVALPNELLAAAASRPGYALGWVQRNVAAYYPAIQIAAVAVDNEMFASPRSSLIALLVPAMTNVHAALVRLGLDGAMKVSSPIALTALRASYPPSAGAFPNDLAERVMRPMLDLLLHTDSYLMVNATPSSPTPLTPRSSPSTTPPSATTPASSSLTSTVDEHLDVVPRGLHPIYVDKSRCRYLVSSDLINHPLFRVLIERSDGGEGMSSAVIIVREVVLLEHLLRMLRNVDVHPSQVDAR
uniref:Glucan endo-1,3-beta-D-glucosidase n=1 Tax=Ananas comosus var. bracteatus TaxID=296719 RepID=A0A6V7P5D8_ANACO|nr:unnamed protein product [Ananas comosus var. bracteatus]